MTQIFSHIQYFHSKEALKLSKEKFIIMIKYAIHIHFYYIVGNCGTSLSKKSTNMHTLTERAVVLCSLPMPMKLSVSGRLEMGSVVILRFQGIPSI